MPLTAPYPLLSDILSAARVSINDSVQSTGGQTLTNTAAFTPILVNRAWQMLQQYLLYLGYVRLRVINYILPNVPASTNLDTQYQATLSWLGYTDGFAAISTTWALPQDLIKPLKLVERINAASPNTNQFLDMSGPEQGITRVPLIPKSWRNVIWTWDNDQIKMPGATSNLDIGIDYAAYLADFTTGSFPGTQTANIMRCEDALAWFIAYVFSEPRGDQETAVCLANARDAAAIIAERKMPSEVVQAAVQQ